MGIDVCSNEGPRLYQGEIIAKWRKKLSLCKNLLSRTIVLVSFKFGANHSLLMEIDVCLNEGQRHVLRMVITIFKQAL